LPQQALPPFIDSSISSIPVYLQHLYHDSLSEDAMYVEYLTDQFMNIHIKTNSMEMPAFVHKTLPSGTQLFNQTKTALKE